MDLKREEVFLSSKLWMTYHQKERAIECLEQTLTKFGTDYIDLYMIHWPFAFKQKIGLSPEMNGKSPVLENTPIEETWEAMESFVASNLVRNIGVCNIGLKSLKNLVTKCKVKPSAVQIENHPYLPQNEIVEYCHANDIKVVAYSPLGGGMKPNVLKDPTVNEVSKELGLSPAQVLLGWQIARGNCVIPRTSKPERLEPNLKVIEIPADSMKKLNSISIRHRFVDSNVFWGIPYPE